MSESDHLVVMRAALLVVLCLLCWGITRGGARLLVVAGGLLVGAALGTALYAALYGLPPTLGDGEAWRELVDAVMGS